MEQIIEKKEELTALIMLGIDYGQGYFLGKPTKALQKIPQSLKDIIRENNFHAENTGFFAQRLVSTIKYPCRLM